MIECPYCHTKLDKRHLCGNHKYMFVYSETGSIDDIYFKKKWDKITGN